jgi:hypothetical protein
MLCKSAFRSSVIDGKATFSEVSKAARNMPNVAATATKTLRPDIDSLPEAVIEGCSGSKLIRIEFYPFRFESRYAHLLFLIAKPCCLC